MNKKILMGLIFLILGIGIFISGIILSNKKQENNSKLEENNVDENPYDNTELIVFDYEEEESPSDLKISFTLYNNTDVVFEDDSLFLDYYDESKKLYTEEIDIPKLAVKEKLEIKDKSLVFIYDKITSHQFRFSMKKVPEANLRDYLNKFGRIDFNLYKTSEMYEKNV